MFKNVEKMMGLRNTNWQLKSSHRNVKYTIGNIVNNIISTIYAARWVLDLSGEISS